MKIGKKEFDLEHDAYIMGILNVTPDSFSDGGNYNDMDKALFHAEQMIKDGAAILDIGGESTRPGHIKISEEEEISRKFIFEEKPDVIINIIDSTSLERLVKKKKFLEYALF